MASTQACGPGAAKMSPTTSMSTMPSPTKPSMAGSWPLPPCVTMVTRSASAELLVDDHVVLAELEDVGVGQGQALEQLRR